MSLLGPLQQLLIRSDHTTKMGAPLWSFTLSHVCPGLDGLAQLIFPKFHSTKSLKTLSCELDELRGYIKEQLYPEEAIHGASYYILEQYYLVSYSGADKYAYHPEYTPFVIACHRFFQALFAMSESCQLGCKLEIARLVGEHLHTPRKDEAVHQSSVLCLNAILKWHAQRYDGRVVALRCEAPPSQLLIYLLSCIGKAIELQLQHVPDRQVVLAFVYCMRRALRCDLLTPTESAQILPKLVLVGSTILEAPKGGSWANSWQKSKLVVEGVALLGDAVCRGLGRHWQHLNKLDLGPAYSVVDDAIAKHSHEHLLQEMASRFAAGDELASEPCRPSGECAFEVTREWLTSSDEHVAILIERVLKPLAAHPSPSVQSALAKELANILEVAYLPKLRTRAFELLLTLAGQHEARAMEVLQQAAVGALGRRAQGEARHVGSSYLAAAVCGGMCNALVSERKLVGVLQGVRGALGLVEGDGYLDGLVRQLVEVWEHSRGEVGEVVATGRLGGAISWPKNDAHRAKDESIVRTSKYTTDINPNVSNSSQSTYLMEKDSWRKHYPRAPCGLSHLTSADVYAEASLLCASIGRQARAYATLGQVVSVLTQDAMQAQGFESLITSRRTATYQPPQSALRSKDVLGGALHTASCLAVLQHVLYGAFAEGDSQVQLARDVTVLGAVDQLLTFLARGPLSAYAFTDAFDGVSPSGQAPTPADLTGLQQSLSTGKFQSLAARVVVQKYALELVAVCAGGLGGAWEGRFMDTCLLPVLEALACGAPAVKGAAYSALLIMASQTLLVAPKGSMPSNQAAVDPPTRGSQPGSSLTPRLYGDKEPIAQGRCRSYVEGVLAAPGYLQGSPTRVRLVALLNANADYLVNGLALRLRNLEGNPYAPALFALLFKQLTLQTDLLPALAGPMYEVFRQLSITKRAVHDARAITSFVRILQSVSNAASDSAAANLEVTRTENKRFKRLHLAALEEMNEDMRLLSDDYEFYDKLTYLGMDAYRYHIFKKHIPVSIWRNLQQRHSVRAVAAHLLGSCVDQVGPLLTHQSPGLAVLAASVTCTALAGLRHVSNAMQLDEPLIEDLPSMLAVVSPPLEEVPKVLPKVHDTWPYVLHTLRSPHAGAVEAGLASLAHVVALSGGQFLQSRFASDAWPLLQHVLCTHSCDSVQGAQAPKVLWRRAPALRDCSAWDEAARYNAGRPSVRRVLLDSSGQHVAYATLDRLHIAVLRCLFKLAYVPDHARVLASISPAVLQAVCDLALASASGRVAEASMKLARQLPEVGGDQVLDLINNRLLRLRSALGKDDRVCSNHIEHQLMESSKYPSMVATLDQQPSSSIVQSPHRHSLTVVATLAAEARRKAQGKRAAAADERRRLIYTTLYGIITEHRGPCTPTPTQAPAGFSEEPSQQLDACLEGAELDVHALEAADSSIRHRAHRSLPAAATQYASSPEGTPAQEFVPLGEQHGLYGALGQQSPHVIEAGCCEGKCSPSPPGTPQKASASMGVQPGSPALSHASSPAKYKTQAALDHQRQQYSLRSQNLAGRGARVQGADSPRSRKAERCVAGSKPDALGKATPPTLDPQHPSGLRPTPTPATTGMTSPQTFSGSCGATTHPHPAPSTAHDGQRRPKPPSSAHSDSDLDMSDAGDKIFEPDAVDEAIAEQEWKLQYEMATGVNLWSQPYPYKGRRAAFTKASMHFKPGGEGSPVYKVEEGKLVERGKGGGGQAGKQCVAACGDAGLVESDKRSCDGGDYRGRCIGGDEASIGGGEVRVVDRRGAAAACGLKRGFLSKYGCGSKSGMRYGKAATCAGYVYKYVSPEPPYCDEEADGGAMEYDAVTYTSSSSSAADGGVVGGGKDDFYEKEMHLDKGQLCDHILGDAKARSYAPLFGATHSPSNVDLTTGNAEAFAQYSSEEHAPSGKRIVWPAMPPQPYAAAYRALDADLMHITALATPSEQPPESPSLGQILLLLRRLHAPHHATCSRQWPAIGSAPSGRQPAASGPALSYKCDVADSAPTRGYPSGGNELEGPCGVGSRSCYGRGEYADEDGCYATCYELAGADHEPGGKLLEAATRLTAQIATGNITPGVNLPPWEAQLLMQMAFCAQHLPALLLSISCLLEQATEAPSTDTLAVTLSPGRSPHQVVEKARGSDAQRAWIEAYAQVLSSFPGPLLVPALQAALRTLDSLDSPAPPILTTLVFAALMQACDFKSDMRMAAFLADTAVINSFGYISGAPDTSLYSLLLPIVLLPEWLQRWQPPKALHRKAYVARLLQSLKRAIARHQDCQSPKYVVLQYNRQEATMVQDPESATYARDYCSIGQAAYGTQEVGETAPKGAHPAFTARVYGQVLLKLCLRGDEALVVEHVLDAAQGHADLAALSALTDAAFSSSDWSTAGPDVPPYIPKAQPGGGTSRGVSAYTEIYMTLKDPRAAAAVRRFLASLLSFACSTCKQRSRFRQLLLALLDARLLTAEQYAPTLAQVILDALLPYEVLDLLEEVLQELTQERHGGGVGGSNIGVWADYRDTPAELYQGSPAPTLGGARGFLTTLQASVCRRFCSLHEVKSAAVSRSAYTTHLLLLCLHVDARAFDAHLPSILEGITARYDCQEEALLGQGNRVLCAVSRDQPVDVGNAVRNSPALPSERWAPACTWEAEGKLHNAGAPGTSAQIRYGVHVARVAAASPTLGHERLMEKGGGVSAGNQQSGLGSDDDDSDAATEAGAECQLSHFTDSDDSDAGSCMEGVEDALIAGLDREGRVWTLPSLMKALRHKDDMLLRLEALQAVEQLVRARPVELEVRAEELFRYVLYADVPDWSRPPSGGHNDAANAMYSALDLDGITTNNLDPTTREMVTSLIQQEAPQEPKYQRGAPGDLSCKPRRKLPGSYKKERDPMVLKLRALTALFSEYPTAAGTSGLMTAGMADLDVTQRSLLLSAIYGAAEYLSSKVNASPLVAGAGTPLHLEGGNGYLGGLGPEQLAELYESADEVESGISTVLLNNGKTKVHLRSLRALHRRNAAMVRSDHFLPLALRWARVSAHVGVAFAARNTPLYTMLGQQVMQTLALFTRLTARTPAGLEVALAALQYARDVALSTCDTSMSRKVLLGLVYTVLCSFTPPALAGVLLGSDYTMRKAVVSGLEWVYTSLPQSLGIVGEGGGGGAAAMGAPDPSTWLAAASEGDIYQLVAQRGSRCAVAAAEWAREQQGVQLPATTKGRKTRIELVLDTLA